MSHTTLSDGRTLNDVMDFDHPIQVHEDGQVTDAPAGIYAPEVFWPDVDWGHSGWSLLSGYTGQCGYNGPVMHSSEYIGGRMARDILETPGIYVAVVVTDMDAEEGTDNCAGWAVAYRETEEA